ncbi:hypothetical protein P3T36_001057 [Kitasatospora sp. MAP12-15]|uniref:hypothetical protein n=1 Tax=unclassified Kitasatospora TaxID=2633591 RepID=UPI002475A7F2|nr:hypothetical protein [Kitasatospora sp. MAP12-44]MDH6114705.1 hypothetical protein [Kitasatospora sp. MAP12-44]
MNRTLKWALVAFAAAGIAAMPGVASAGVPSSGGAVVIGDDNQIAGQDIFDAGHNNTVGSHNGTDAGVGDNVSGDTSPGANGMVLIGDRNQVAGDDLFNAANDNTVGSHNGSSAGVGDEGVATAPMDNLMNGLVDL